MTTNADLIADARALDAEATPGPWFYFISEPGGFERGAKPAGIYPHDDPNDDEAIAFLRTAEQDDTDAAFIARSRTLLPQLADALEAADAESASYRAWAGKLLASPTPAEAESAGRLRVLTEKADEARREWQRAENAEARLAKVRERAIVHDHDELSSCMCSLCPNAWAHTEPDVETHAPDCPARPMELTHEQGI